MSNLRTNLEGNIKFSLSISLLVYSIIVAILRNTIIIPIAMFMSTIGDIYMMISRGCLTEEKEDAFNTGVFAFGSSHMMYILGMPTKYLRELFFISLVLILLLLIIDAFIQKYKVVYICILYAVILILNAVNAFNFSLLAAFGMVLFIISDSVLVICKIIGKRNMACHIAIWATYVLAQICLLTSVLIK